MNFELTEAQRAFQDSVRVFAERHLAAGALARAHDARFPWDVARAMAEAGLFGIMLPEADGGAGGSLMDAVLAMEQIAYVCPRSADVLQAGNFGAFRTLAEYATPSQRERYFSRLLTGETIAAVAMTEPDAGSALTELKTACTPDGDGWRLNGGKVFTSNTEDAGVFLVYCRFAPGTQGIGSVLVERGAEGFSFGAPSRYMNGETWCALYFDNVRIEPENVLLKQGGFRKQIAGFNVERIGNTTRALALGEYCFRQARAHAETRRQFDRTLSEFQGIQWKFAEMRVALDAAQLLLYRAATRGANGLPDAQDVAIAKYACNQAGWLAANEFDAGDGRHRLFAGPADRILRPQDPRLDDRRRLAGDDEEPHRRGRVCPQLPAAATEDGKPTDVTFARALLNPRRIALVGASSDAAKLTARAQIYLRRHGFSGALYPVNPRAQEVLGEPAFASLRDVQGAIDFAYVLVNTGQVEAAIEACAERRVPVACVLADGFAETGADGIALQARVLAAARAGGVRLLGPNSMGMINIPARIACSVNAALAADHLIAGRWSLISQSGSMMGTLLSRAAARGTGFAKIIGTGNEADLGAGELLSVLADDPETDVILLFLETIRRPELFEQGARRAHAAGKPVIVYKLGRSEAGAALATTHTGALAGSDAASDAFFRACGIVRVDMLETLLELPPLLLGARQPSSPRRAVRLVTTTGGGGAMLVDRLGKEGIATVGMVDTTLAGAGRDFVASALTEARGAGDCDVAIAVIGSSAQFRPQDAIAGVIAAKGQNPLAAFLLPQADASLRLLGEAGIAAFRTPESCADAIRAFLDWRAPRPAPDSVGPTRPRGPAAGGG